MGCRRAARREARIWPTSLRASRAVGWEAKVGSSQARPQARRMSGACLHEHAATPQQRRSPRPSAAAELHSWTWGGPSAHLGPARLAGSHARVDERGVGLEVGADAQLRHGVKHLRRRRGGRGEARKPSKGGEVRKSCKGAGRVGKRAQASTCTPVRNSRHASACPHLARRGRVPRLGVAVQQRAGGALRGLHLCGSRSGWSTHGGGWAR